MCLVLLAAALLLTSCSGSSGAGTAPPPTAADTSPFVTTSGDHFVGRGGQLVQLRGFNIHTLDPAVYQEAVTLGANFIRVTTPWSDYETVPPTGDVHHWDMARLAELDQLVSFCNEHHISLLLDFHQYGWSPYFAAVQRGGRANGIPAWFYQDGRYPVTPRGLDRAKEQFFNDPEGAERYRHSPSVMGYEIMNEPDTGTLPRNHATTQLVVRWEAQVLGRLRAVDDTRTTVFMLRGGPSMGALHADLTDFGPLGHLALDVHDYFAGTGGSGYKPDGENVNSQYTSTLQGAPYTGTLASQAAYLDVGVRAARRFGVPLIEGEWGAFRSMPGIEVYQSQMVTLLDSMGISWARWSLDRAEELSVLNRDGSPTPAATQLQQLLHSPPVTTAP
jgi:hypothetical protein